MLTTSGATLERGLSLVWHLSLGRPIEYPDLRERAQSRDQDFIKWNYSLP